ncbi:hypothetical protein BO71DRAFT_400978 [Aspergillus ellipticus CBS 707.79]|uniref:Uncharacterized protein n=1 Tax=Aspergillus ellipticus CBS 707.79 TaxID=1448320 RepID=A0A319DKY2_9EURO|nr:hypothetical protein BO71DRAFT_400978 [Aspergillus ellipticus CBS 707.79]
MGWDSTRWLCMVFQKGLFRFPKLRVHERERETPGVCGEGVVVWCGLVWSMRNTSITGQENTANFRAGPPIP